MSLATLEATLARRAFSFSPFFMLGDPNPELALEMALTAAGAGAHMLELGFPFSDPVADGPAVQGACRRALAAGVTVDRSLELMSELRLRMDLPFNLLVYGNLVHRRGARSFARDVVAAGASSLLVPDVSFEEGELLRDACAEAGLGVVHLVGPRTAPERIRLLSAASTGFVYLAGHQGITGARQDLDPSIAEMIAKVVETSSAPVCVGFGLRTPGHVAAVKEAGARMAVVGSALLEPLGRAMDGHAMDPASQPFEADAFLEGLRHQIETLAAAAGGPPLRRSPC